MAVDVLVISGAAGVGKSSTAYEISHQLRIAGVAHAVLDSDELDHIYPLPRDLPRLTERDLAAVWEGLRAYGARRLVLVGVFLHRPSESAWIARAVPGARFTHVQLVASRAVLVDRIRRREIGSGADCQIARTMAQLEALEPEEADVRLVPTDAAPVEGVAREIIRLWLGRSCRGDGG